MLGQELFCVLLFLHAFACQEVSFPDQVMYSQGCGGRWSVTGTVTLTPGEKEGYNSKVTIQTTTGDWDEENLVINHVCVVDLDKSDYTSPLPDGDACDVIGKIDDEYTFTVNRLMQPEDAGLFLQAVLTSHSESSTTLITSPLIQLPNITVSTNKTSRFTFQLNQEQVVNIGPFDNALKAYVCGDPFVAKFCAVDPPEGSTLTIYTNEHKTTSELPCIETGRYFNFLDSTDNEIYLDYEDTVCFIRKRITVTLSISKCEDNPVYACKNYEGSKKREIRRLTQGYDVLCDTDTDNGRWIVFQRRNSSEVNFHLGWENYTAGFGQLENNFWLGLNKIHSLCDKPYACLLRIDITFNGTSYQATYKDFSLGGASDNFRLHVGNYYGDAGDVFTTRGNGQQFTTIDKDNDMSPNNCAVKYHGAWWYDYCHEGNLNGLWNNTEFGDGLNWFPTTGYTKSVTFSEMKIRVRHE